MPLFTRELNALADAIGASALTLWLHTAAPTEADATNGRTTVGGGGYESGLAVPATEISNASAGDIMINVAKNFGAADEDVGTVTHWSLVRGSDGVAYGTLPSTQINNGDSFTINANTLRILGSTT